MSAEFSTLQLQTEGPTNKDALQFMAYIEIIQAFMGKEKEDLAWMGMPLQSIQFVAIIQSAVARKDATYVCPDHTRDSIFLRSLSIFVRKIVQIRRDMEALNPRTQAEAIREALSSYFFL